MKWVREWKCSTELFLRVAWQFNDITDYFDVESNKGEHHGAARTHERVSSFFARLRRRAIQKLFLQ